MFWFLLGLWIGGTMGFLCAALFAASDEGDDNDEK